MLRPFLRLPPAAMHLPLREKPDLPTASRDSQSASVIMPAASCRLVQQRPLRSVLARSLTFDSATNAALHLAAQKGSVAALLADRELGILAALLGDRFGPALGHLI
jgi:hypothetical protein